jgi:hypothetical protein
MTAMYRTRGAAVKRSDKFGPNATHQAVVRLWAFGAVAQHRVEPFDGQDRMVCCAFCTGSLPAKSSAFACRLYVPDMAMQPQHCGGFRALQVLGARAQWRGAEGRALRVRAVPLGNTGTTTVEGAR